jgi:hypothetical protein
MEREDIERQELEAYNAEEFRQACNEYYESVNQLDIESERYLGQGSVPIEVEESIPCTEEELWSTILIDERDDSILNNLK